MYTKRLIHRDCYVLSIGKFLKYEENTNSFGSVDHVGFLLIFLFSVALIVLISSPSFVFNANNIFQIRKDNKFLENEKHVNFELSLLYNPKISSTIAVVLEMQEEDLEK
ncbi:Gamma-aminobutyric acid type B receptor subunit [Dirofilaria immitis]